jgi:dimethylaniline monooxygenase (N-oxide forming)
VCIVAAISGHRPPDALPLTCVIGAGAAGLTAVKALADHGVPFDCFERSPRIGGLWAYGNPSGTPTAYRSLRINTSKARTQLADHPMPADYPDLPDHGQIAAYLQSYAERFDLLERITLSTEVREARLRPDGLWEVELTGGGSRAYDALVVANGHHWDPLWPDPPVPGEFEGEQIHAVDYDVPERFAGKRVVVVGLGNSALDIAADLGGIAEGTFISARRGAHILPRRLLGRPTDQVEWIPPAWLPWRVRKRIAGVLLMRALRREARRPADCGLPEPAHRLHQGHPSTSDEIFDAIESGRVEPRPGLVALEGDSVRFADGRSEPADAIVYCTGYRVSFPFFDPRLISAPGNELGLYRRIFHPEIGSVFFAGLVQPIGPTINVVEAQAKLIAAHLSGRHALPSRARMRARIERDRRAIARRYVPSPRHTMQVDFPAYMAGVDRELRAGRRRAALRAYEPSVEPRAARRYERASPNAQAA